MTILLPIYVFRIHYLESGIPQRGIQNPGLSWITLRGAIVKGSDA